MSPLSGERYSEGPGAANSLPLPEEHDLAGAFRERLRLFALRRVRDAAAAEDLAQEALRRVSMALREGRLENPAALAAFVFQTARHLCLQRNRSAARESRALSRWGAEQAQGMEGVGDALLGLVNEERRAAVRRALARLEPPDRHLLEQFYYHDAGTPEVARSLGVSAEALRVRKHRALKRLAVQLGDAENVTP
jgi:RNA polymerase sigma factor (sigma-70 family)